MKWIIQGNLIYENDLKQIETTCEKLGVDFQSVQIIPFDTELPKFDVHPDNVYYGSTTFMYNLYNMEPKPRGLFFNENFSMENYNKRYGVHMLNYGAIFTTFKELQDKYINKPGEFTFHTDTPFFIRPDSDDKSFDGTVMKFGEIMDWHKRFTRYENSNLDENTKIMIGEAFNITKEWRNLVVDGKIVTSTLYRKNFQLSKSATDIPEDMLDFTNRMISHYKPHDNFAIDVCKCGDSYFIVELGCLNSVGFYHCDIPKFVEAITLYMQK